MTVRKLPGETDVGVGERGGGENEGAEDGRVIVNCTQRADRDRATVVERQPRDASLLHHQRPRT